MSTTTAPTTPSEKTAGKIHIPSGIVGFPHAQNFTLTGGNDGIFDLQCDDDPVLGFVVISPSPYFPDYAPTIDDATAERLQLKSQDDALVFIVVNLGDNKKDPQANLMAPLIVNRHTMVASQAVLADQGYPLRAAIPA